MKCDIHVVDEGSATVACSVLGETRGAYSIEKDLVVEPLRTPWPECDACLLHKSGLFGSKAFFSCLAMEKFRVKKNSETLEAAIKAAHGQENS